MLIGIPCTLMRGGTSRGLFFDARDLPADTRLRDSILVSAMGSNGHGQIDGVGGGTPLTSKVAIVGRSTHPAADVDYLFAQVGVDRPVVDTSPNCGNMLSGVAAFAIERNLVRGRDPETSVIVHNVNTGSLIEVIQKTPRGEPNYLGDTVIDGVPGTAAPVKVNFLDAIGAVTGKLLPSGAVSNVIDGVTVSLIDMAMPVMLVDATSVGATGLETPDDIDHDRGLKLRLEALRLEAGRLMGLGDVSGRVVPKMAMVALDPATGSLVVRYFTPQTCHTSLAVTGAVCLAAAAALPGSVVHRLQPLAAPGGQVDILHPKGQFTVELEVSNEAGETRIGRASVLRTARKLFEGEVKVPATAWPRVGQHLYAIAEERWGMREAAA
jgi:hypothetical protein